MDQPANAMPETLDNPTVVGATIKELNQKEKLTGLDQVEINLIYNNGVKHQVWNGPDIVQESAGPANIQPKLLNLTGKSASQAHDLIEDYALKQEHHLNDMAEQMAIDPSSVERVQITENLDEYLHPVPGDQKLSPNKHFSMASKEEIYTSLSHSLHHWESKVNRYSDLVDFSQKWEGKIQALSQNVEQTKTKLNRLDSEIDSLISDIYKDPIDSKKLRNSINKLKNDPRNFGTVKDSFNRSFVDKVIAKENSQLLAKSNELSEHLNWWAQTKGKLINLQERSKSVVQELSLSKVKTNLTMEMGMRHPITVDMSLSEVSNPLQKHSKWAKRRLNYAKSKVNTIKPVLSKHLSSELSKKGAKHLSSKVSSITKKLAKVNPKAKALTMVYKQVKKMTKAHALEQ